MQLFKRVLVLFWLSTLFTQLQPHGFSEGTLVQLHNGQWMRMDALARDGADECIASYDFEKQEISCGKIERGRCGSADCYLRLGFDTYFNDDVLCTTTQIFYTPLDRSWTQAMNLRVGDCLLTIDGSWIPITHIELVERETTVYTLSIEHTHTFFVGRYSVLTHNMESVLAPEFSNLALAFASALGCSTTVATGINIAAGAVVFTASAYGIDYLLKHCRSKHDSRPTYHVHRKSQPAEPIEELERMNIGAAMAKSNGGSERIAKAIEEAAAKEQEPERPKKRMVYQVANYHPVISLLRIGSCKENFKGVTKSPCPPWIEGQALLSFLSFPTTNKHRVAYFAGYFVEFYFELETQDSIIYHGFYLLEDPASFDSDLSKELQKRGIANGKGRIKRTKGPLS